MISDDPAPFIKAALDEARASLQEGGIPVGAVLVRDGRIIGRGRNRRVQTGDPTAHAEIECFRNAGPLGSAAGLVMYSSSMPCHLCAGALVQFGIEYLVVGDATTHRGASAYLKDHWVQVDRVNDADCIALLESFIASHADIWNEELGGN